MLNADITEDEQTITFGPVLSTPNTASSPVTLTVTETDFKFAEYPATVSLTGVGWLDGPTPNTVF